MITAESPDAAPVTLVTDRHIFRAPPLASASPPQQQPAWHGPLTGMALCGFLILGIYSVLARLSPNAAPWFIKVAVLLLFGLSLGVTALAWMASRRQGRSSVSGAMPPAESPMILEDLRLIHPWTLLLGRPFTVALQARLPAGAPTVRPPHSVKFSILRSRTPLSGAGKVQRGRRIGSVTVPTDAAWQDPGGSKCLRYEGRMKAPRGLRRFDSEYWYVAVEDTHAPEDSPAVLISELSRPVEPALRTPAWRPDRIEQLDALLCHRTHEVFSRAYPRPPSDSPADGFADYAPTEREQLAVFTVTFDELVRHAVSTDWLERHVRRCRTMGDALVYLLHDGIDYQVIRSERDSGQTLFASRDPRAAVAFYLAYQNSLPPLPGLEAIAFD